MDRSAVEELYRRSEKPIRERIRRRARRFGERTKDGGRNFQSAFSARSATRTAVVSANPEVLHFSNLTLEDRSILDSAEETAGRVNGYLRSVPLIGMERTIGRNSPIEGRTRLLLSLNKNKVPWSGKKNIRLALMLHQLVFPQKQHQEDGHMVVYVPEFGDKPQIIYFADQRLHYILGDDYTGELWKSNARDIMWFAQNIGLLPMHAGVQLARAYDGVEKKLKTYVLAFFGLSKTGKSTRSCNDNGLDRKGEFVKIMQDDITALDLGTGEIFGTSDNFYCVTEGLDPACQKVLYNAALRRGVLYENATLTENGDIVFREEEMVRRKGCLNPRAVLRRRDFGKHYSEEINTPPLDEIDGMFVIFITRDYTIMPFVSELDPAQLGAAYILGETIDNPATTKDQSKWGKTKREPGTDPFTPGNPAYRANLLYRFYRMHPEKVRGFLINTGGVGGDPETGKKETAEKIIQIGEMTNAINGILRGTARFGREDWFGTDVLVSANGIDYAQWLPWNYYSAEEYRQLVSKRKRDRVEYIGKYPGLDGDIRRTIVGS